MNNDDRAILKEILFHLAESTSSLRFEGPNKRLWKCIESLFEEEVDEPKKEMTAKELVERMRIYFLERSAENPDNLLYYYDDILKTLEIKAGL